MKEENIKILKLTFAIITILSLIIPAILALGSLNEKVKSLEKKIDSNEPIQLERFNNLDYRIIELEKIAAGTEVSLTVIQSDITEIKSDLKEVLKGLKINPEGK